MERQIVYFEDVQPDNTEITLRLVKEKLNATGIKKVVLASTTGATAVRALEYFKEQGIQIIVVPHQYDFKRKQNPFPQELVKTLIDAGHAVHFGTMLFHTGDFYGSTTPTVMANLLRCFSQGVKVCFEIVLMVADAGLVTPGEQVIAIAGTGRGSDTALIMQASSSQHLNRLRVNEIICKPLNTLNLDE
ncbi:MAG TPA: pyruvate kinase alpha/beta domain-containing protein [Syntrophomonadaceae bacterium]|nr:pyruvate kinase alpha/beta domain-containing protein [Syntrophomonadaceae bacterium]